MSSWKHCDSWQVKGHLSTKAEGCNLKSSSLTILIILITAFVSPSLGQQTAGEWIKKGDTFFDQGNFNGALVSRQTCNVG